MPDVGDFTSASWQASRTDEQLARLIYEGRGALMPAFRGTLTKDECYAMARYLRRFAAGESTTGTGIGVVQSMVPGTNLAGDSLPPLQPNQRVP